LVEVDHQVVLLVEVQVVDVHQVAEVVVEDAVKIN
jgi:hypothetical protein